MCDRRIKSLRVHSSACISRTESSVAFSQATAPSFAHSRRQSVLQKSRPLLPKSSRQNGPLSFSPILFLADLSFKTSVTPEMFPSGPVTANPKSQLVCLAQILQEKLCYSIHKENSRRRIGNTMPPSRKWQYFDVLLLLDEFVQQ